MRTNLLRIIVVWLFLIGSLTYYVEAAPKTIPSRSGNPTVVLPSEYSRWKVITVNSPEYKKILAERDDLRAQVDAERLGFENYQETVDKTILAKEEENRRIQQDLLKAQAKAKKNWFAAVFGWVLGLGFPLLFIGLIVLCAFFPALIPLVMNVIMGLINAVIKVIQSVGSWLSIAWSKVSWTSKKSSPPPSVAKPKPKSRIKNGRKGSNNR